MFSDSLTYGICVANDITAHAYNLPAIRSAFAHAYHVLCGAFYETDHRHHAERIYHNEILPFRVFSLLGAILDIEQTLVDHRIFVTKKYTEFRTAVEKTLSCTGELEQNYTALNIKPQKARKQRRKKRMKKENVEQLHTNYNHRRWNGRVALQDQSLPPKTPPENGRITRRQSQQSNTLIQQDNQKTLNVKVKEDKSTWTESEDLTLIRRVQEAETETPSWRWVSQVIPGRTSNQCRHRWNRLKK
jgi:hypothetical protein